MALRKYWIGSTGPFLYDDTGQYADLVDYMSFRGEGIIQGASLVISPTTSGNVLVADGSAFNSVTPDAGGLVTKAGVQTVDGVKYFSNGLKTIKIYPNSDGTTALQITKADGSTYIVNIDTTNSRVGIGTNAPSAKLHIAAGSTGAGTAPLKLTTQASGLSSVEQGAFELIGNSLQFTQLAKRRGVSMGQNVRTSTTTVENTTTESAALITAEHGANYLEVGKMEEIVLYGTIAQRSNPNAQLTVRIKYAGTTVQTFTTPASSSIASGTVFRLAALTTCRAIGGTGTLQIDSSFVVRGVLDTGGSTAATIDTTTAQDTTITVQWGEANAADIFTVTQGRILCIDTDR